MTQKHETKADLALRVLRERILNGDFAPGAKLDINRIAAELEMSPTPVREAMRLLQADRLISYMAHRRIVVAELSERQLEQIFDLRMLLEPAAVETAARTLDAERLAQLERLHVEVVAASAASAAQFAQRNAEWHWTVYGGAQSPYLADFIGRLWDAFPWRTMVSIGERRSVAVAEHEAIMVALRRRDATGAAALMKTHIATSRRLLRLPAQARVARPEWLPSGGPR